MVTCIKVLQLWFSLKYQLQNHFDDTLIVIG